MTFPETLVSPIWVASFKVEFVTVEGSMSSEKPAVNTWPSDMLIELLFGLTPRTVGAVESVPLPVRK